ncbi:hypothetical protein TNCV_3309501 [Trichonephila clavipes]|nr:hypothetical protein TNCV_3309501 [Trichonephila clavipes]
MSHEKYFSTMYKLHFLKILALIISSCQLGGVVGLTLALYAQECGFQPKLVDFHDGENQQRSCGIIMWPVNDSLSTCLAAALHFLKIAILVRQDISSWRQAPGHEWYKGNSAGAALLGTSRMLDETIPSRLLSGHTRGQWQVAGLKVYPPCPN